MKTNRPPVVRGPLLCAACAVLCAGLCVPAFIAGTSGLGGLYLAAAAHSHAPELEVQDIERFCDERFPLSYEIPKPGKAGVLGADYPVTRVETNSHYQRILGFPMVAGSFFSKQAWKSGERHAVLNEKAAFDLFGSDRAVSSRLRLGGETWIVTGILHDGDDENRRIYVPSRRGTTTSLLARSGENGAPQDLATLIHSLRSLGVYDSGFNFYELGAGRLWEGAAVALMLLCCMVPALLIPPALGKLRTACSRLRRELRDHYLPELLCSGPLFTFFCSALVPPACAAVILFTLSRVISICLPWRDLPSLGSLDPRVLCPGIAMLRHCETASTILLWLFLVSLAALVVYCAIRLLGRRAASQAA